MNALIRNRSQSQWCNNESSNDQNINKSNISQPLQNKHNLNIHQQSKYIKQQNKCQVQKSNRKFTVAVRIKPQLNQTRKDIMSMKIKNIDNQYEQLSVSNPSEFRNHYAQSLEKSKKFIFDKVYSEHSQNIQIYESLLKEKIQLLKRGINVSVLAYGATNSGKTYTIFGKQSENNINANHQRNGISSMVFKQIMQQFNRQYTFQFSFLQIYNENIFDLLEYQGQQQMQSKPLSMMQNQEGDIHMVGLKKKQILNFQELFNFIQKGNEKRTSCNNIHNAQSSRSHAFMQLQLTHKITRHKVKMVIVDLAGSQKYISGSFLNDKNSVKSNILLKQGSNINKSLLSLGNCIKSLYQGQKHVPYRDSKLTRLLKQNLSGYSHNVMIACIGQNTQKWQESVNTLNYALKATKIQKALQKRYQDQQLSNYTCLSCQQKIPYCLIHQILKNEESNSHKRVKKNMKASLSMPNSPTINSPAVQNSTVINWFSKSKKNSKKYLNSHSVKNKIQHNFALMKKQLLDKTQQIMLASSENRKQNINQFFEDKKRQLLSSLESLLQTPEKQSIIPQRNQSNILDLLNQTTVSQFNTTFRNNSSNRTNFRQESNESNLTNKTRRVKISLSKNSKKQKEDIKSIKQVNTCDKTSFSSILKTQKQKNQNKSQLFDQIVNKSQVNRKNLTVRVSDNQRVLQERKQVLNQLFLTHNQRKNVMAKFKSGSSNQAYKGKNVKAFQINHKSFDQQAQNLIQKSIDNQKYYVKSGFQDQFIKIEQSERNNDESNYCIGKNRMLDSTSIAPRMRRDEDQLVGTWKNIFIKKIESAKKQSVK